MPLTLSRFVWFISNLLSSKLACRLQLRFGRASHPPRRRTTSSSWSWETEGQTQTADNRRYNRCSHILSPQFSLTFALTFSTDDLHLPSYLLSPPNTPLTAATTTYWELSPSVHCLQQEEGVVGGGVVVPPMGTSSSRRNNTEKKSGLRSARRDKTPETCNLTLQLLHTLVVICSHKKICQ